MKLLKKRWHDLKLKITEFCLLNDFDPYWVPHDQYKPDKYIRMSGRVNVCLINDCNSVDVNHEV